MRLRADSLPRLINPIVPGKPTHLANTIHQIDNLGLETKLHFQSWRCNTAARFTVSNVQELYFKYPSVNIGDQAH